MLQVGMKNTRQVKVSAENTALRMGSGTLEVFATPAMLALMEETAWRTVAPGLEPGQGTVGTLLNVEHSAPTPVGMTVTCEAELTQVDGRKLTFHVRAWDEAGPIGEGTHQRFIINDEKFQAKANQKANK